MKRILFYFNLLLVITLLLQVSACKKVEQAILQDPCADIKFCNIRSFVYPGYQHSDSPDTATFTYDASGNPLTVNNTFVGTGYPNLIFRYDASHRLTEFIRPYSNGQFETWSKYIYNSSGKIAFDTTWVFGTVTAAGPVNAIEQRLTTYTYDNTCRITRTSYIAVTGSHVGMPAVVNDYAYDSNGNLIRPGATYDNKVNIHRTNKVFMFVDRDFSRNNPFTATSYNGYSLPKEIGMPNPGPSLYFLLRPIDNAVFYYQCD